MRKTIELCNADLTREVFEDVMFLSFAEGGAMGEPGGILFFNKYGEFYHLNYVYGDAELDKVVDMFPILDECVFGMFGMGSVVPNGWNYVNLGMGNHLIVNDEVCDLFMEKLGDVQRPSEVYQKWIGAAREVFEIRD